MRNFTFYSPTFFAFGKDTEKDAGKYVRRFGGTKVLIHYGGGSLIRSGLLDRVKASLEEEGLPYVVLGGVKPNPRSGLVYEGIDLCRKEGVDFVLAVGGRSTQDWNSHNIEHELSAEYDCAHGAGLAVTMPAVFTYVMEHDVMRFAKAAVRVWGCQMDFDHPERTAKAGIEAFRSFLISLGMPKNFAELGAKEEDIPKLVHTLCCGDGRKGSIRGFVTLNEEDCARIYKMMV